MELRFSCISPLIWSNTAVICLQLQKQESLPQFFFYHTISGFKYWKNVHINLLPVEQK